MATQQTWYNDREAGIIPAHTGFCVPRGKPGAKIRRRLMAVQQTWYNVHNVNIIPAHTGFRVHRGKPGAEIRRRLSGREGRDKMDAKRSFYRRIPEKSR